MKHTILSLLLICLSCLSINAQNKEEADSAYTKGNYQLAIKIYEEILKQGENANVYYNLGNAYYRTGNIANAILAYERANLRNPADSDIRFNLAFARSKTLDKSTEESEMFFVSWAKALVNLNNADGWGRFGIVSLVLCLTLILFYLLSSKMLLRKIGFFGGLAMLLLVLASISFAFIQNSKLMQSNSAIVMTNTQLLSTPSQTGTRLTTLHPGTKVEITDNGLGTWCEVNLADGKKGWISSNSIETI